MEKLIAYLRLMRPPNLPTAVADILLGFAISGSVISLNQGFENVWHYEFRHLDALPWLILSTLGLYGGGVVMNDVFDYRLDQIERPERPIPSGLVPLSGAIILGICLLLIGVLAAFQVNLMSAGLASGVVALVLLYDALAKHHPLFGPLTMGACRGGNLLLGLSIVSGQVINFWFIALIPIVYIAAITMVSRGEVHGGNRISLVLAMLLFIITIVSVTTLGVLPQYNSWNSLPFLGMLAIMIFPPLIKALKSLQAKDIFKTVKAGVIALIILDAGIAAGFGGFPYGILVLFLLPLSILLVRLFAVT